MQSKTLFLLTVTCVILLACGQATSTTTTTEKTGVFTTDEWNMMQTADSVLLFRLKLISPLTPMALPREMTEQEFQFEDSRGLDRNYYSKPPRHMSSEETKALFPFVSEQTKKFTAFQRKGECEYQPGAGIKFYKGSEKFYLLLCFNCNVWAFERRNALYYVDFDKSQRAALVKYAKGLFPGDAEFKALRE